MIEHFEDEQKRKSMKAKQMPYDLSFKQFAKFPFNRIFVGVHVTTKKKIETID